MSKRVLWPDGFVLSWLGVLLIVFGSLSWLPAAAQDATPGDVPAVETTGLEPDVTEPALPPVTEPALPPVTELPTSVPPAPPIEVIATEDVAGEPLAARTNLITTLAAPQVTGITITCSLPGTTIDGIASVSDPAAATIVLQLVTTIGPASVPLRDVTLELVPGQTSYTFIAELEANDHANSTSKEVVVTGPGGTPVSKPIRIEQGGDGSTICTPEGSSSPTEPTAPETTATPTPTPGASETATSTTTPMSSVGRVSNTGASNLNCRAEPTTSSAILTRLPAGATIEVRGAAAGGWVPVRCANQDGWVSAAYLVITTAPISTATPVATATFTATPTPTGTLTYGTVNNTGGSNLRCRTAPNTTASIITLLPSGMRVEARGAVVNGWLPIRCGG